MPTIKDSSELPEYRDTFDSWQIEMESYLAEFLEKHTRSEYPRLHAKMLLRVVLGVFRPDKFRFTDLEQLKRQVEQIVDNLEEIRGETEPSDNED